MRKYHRSSTGSNSLFHSLVIPYYLVIPCLVITSLKMLSGIFLEELQTAFAEEWENITGASLTARVSRAVWIELCDRSTIIPNRFISSTTVWKRKKNKNILCTVCNQILVYVSVSVSVTYSCLYAYKKEAVVENNCFLCFTQFIKAQAVKYSKQISLLKQHRKKKIRWLTAQI